MILLLFKYFYTLDRFLINAMQYMLTHTFFIEYKYLNKW